MLDRLADWLLVVHYDCLNGDTPWLAYYYN